MKPEIRARCVGNTIPRSAWCSKLQAARVLAAHLRSSETTAYCTQLIPSVRTNVLVRAAAATVASARFDTLEAYNVEDIMTKGTLVTCAPETPLDKVLQILVENQVTGLPVVDEEGSVVGVVSDFDLLAREGVKEKDKTRGLFPEAGTEWSSFFEVQKLLVKNAGQCAGDVMTSDPVCVRPNTTVEDAANLLLRMRIRRLPVVDERGRLLGIITRSNIIRAAWELRRTAGTQG